MEDTNTQADGVTPEAPTTTGATPNPGTIPGEEDTPPDGVTPKGEASEGALHKALRNEREAHKRLEKEKTELVERMKTLETELSGFRKRDAADTALRQHFNARAKAGLPVKGFDLDKAKGLLMRLPESEIESAAADLVGALGLDVRNDSPIKGQPVKDEGPALKPGTLSFSQLQKVNAYGGRDAVDAVRTARKT